MSWRKGSRLHLVHEGQSSGRTREIFEEIRAALGISFVPLCFRAFAAYPKFLDVDWQEMKPLLATRDYFELAARLRAEAYTYVHNYFKIPPLGDGLMTSEVLPVADLFCYVDSAMLLLLSVQLQAFDGVVGNVATTRSADRASHNTMPQFVATDAATPPVRRVLEDIRHSLELPYAGEEQSALAHWPDFLFSYWRALKPAVQSLFHEQAVFRMRESAWSFTQEIPVEVDLEYSRLTEAGLNAEEIATVGHLTELLVRGMSASLLNVTFAKIGLEGGNRGEAAASRTPEERAA